MGREMFELPPPVALAGDLTARPGQRSTDRGTHFFFACVDAHTAGALPSATRCPREALARTTLMPQAKAKAHSQGLS